MPKAFGPQTSGKNSPRKRFHTVRTSIWFFPLILTFVLLMLTCLKINGSSIGVYQTYFYGQPHDSALITGHPRKIRSDEWVVNTQMTIAQKNANYARINHNIGNGEDMSLILDVPNRDWSTIFKPHNWSFFALPFDFAFAFKWWVMGYLLVLSCYFFVLALLPNKKLFAAFLALALASSAFVQWWYQYITLGPLYYSLFAGTAFIYILRARTRTQAIGWGALLAYILICFVLVLYPPFQIACALALAAFAIGYMIRQSSEMQWKLYLQRLGIFGASIVLAGLVILLFLSTRSGVVHTILNTAYPGNRLQQSGGYDLPHLFSGNLAFQFHSDIKAANYQLPKLSVTNQSEASNFILLLPFLLLPSLYFLYQDFRNRRAVDWPLLITSLAFLGTLVWLFTPHLGILGKLTLLNRVPHSRLLIGLGILNIFQIVLLVRRLDSAKVKLFSRTPVALYAVLVFIVELLLGLYALHTFPGFVGIYRVIAFSLPIPIIVYTLLRKQFTWAAVGLFAFSAFTSFLINPLYRGTAILTDTPLTRAIHEISHTTRVVGRQK